MARPPLEVADLVRVWTTRASPSVQEEYRWDVLWMRGELARQQQALNPAPNPPAAAPAPGSVAAPGALPGAPVVGQSAPKPRDRAELVAEQAAKSLRIRSFSGTDARDSYMVESCASLPPSCSRWACLWWRRLCS